MAHAYSQVLEAGLAIVAKRRKSASEVESMAVIGEIKGKNILIVDDLTETAGTSDRSREFIEEKGGKTDIGVRFPRYFRRNGHRKITKIKD